MAGAINLRCMAGKQGFLCPQSFVNRRQWQKSDVIFGEEVQFLRGDTKHSDVTLLITFSVTVANIKCDLKFSAERKKHW